MVSQVVQAITKEQLKPLYVIHGPETYLQEQVLQSLYQRVHEHEHGEMNWRVVYGSKTMEAGTILQWIRSRPWGAGLQVTAIRQADQVPAEVWSELLAGFCPAARTTLALFFTRLDKRTKVSRSLLKAGEEVDCQQLQGGALARWVSDTVALQGRRLRRDALELFLARVGRNLAIVHSELEKLLLYADQQSEIGREDVERVTSIVPGQLEQGVVFQLTDAIAARDSQAALPVLQQLLDAGETVFRILPLLERQLRLQLAARSLSRSTLSCKEAAALMGETSDYPLRKTMALADRYSEEELLAGFRLVVEADRDLKLSADPEQVLEQLIQKLCTPAMPR